MAPSFDCAVSSLLCAEDKSIFDDSDYGGLVDECEEPTTWYHRNHRTHIQNRSIGNGFGLPLQSDECLTSMVEKECQHIPNPDYLKRLRSGDLDTGARKEAVDWISKANAHLSFGPLCAYLSINYLDRFLSAYELPKGKAWTMQLLAVACLSLAAKMEEAEVPLTLDLQVGELKYVFEARTIRRMELLILSTLRWRMHAVTPYSFIDYFLRTINGDDQVPVKASIVRAIQVILTTNKGIDFLEFRPSEVAAAVAISVTGEAKTVDTEKAVSLLVELVEKERVLKCIQLIHDLSLINGSSGSIQSVPQSPIGVLDAACLSYKSDDTTVGSCANSSSHSSTDTKRRKLNRPCEVEL